MEKQEYLQKMEIRLTEYNAKLAELRAQVFGIQSEMRREYLGQIRGLESKRDKLRELYGQLKETSVCGWEDAKDGTEKAFIDFKEAFDKAINLFEL